MREFMLNSEDLLDRYAVSFMEEGLERGLIPCRWIRFNERIKLGFFTEEYAPLSERLPDLSRDDICEVCIELMERVRNLETCPQISLENVVWDDESIYLDRRGHVFLICLPAVIPEETLRSQIYVKRIYALLEELLSGQDAVEIIRQIDYQQKKTFGDWQVLQGIFERTLAEDGDSSLVLRSINTPRPLRFYVGFDDYMIGTDAALSDGVITGVETVSPVHAKIGWNDIGHYICDQGSPGGTFVNDRQITPGIEVPIGKGTVLRFAEYTFNVE